MNKTIYVRDEDEPIWDKARELAGDKLSPVIMDGLKRYVIQKEAETKDFKRIEVRFEDADDNYIPKAKAFYGTWIIPPDNPFEETEEDGTKRKFMVALTARGRAVFCSWTGGVGMKHNARFVVFGALHEAAADPWHNDVARRAIETLGLQVEELDI
jgi:hypothetical protein